MSDADIGLMADFKRGTSTVGEILNIGSPSLSRDVVDSTHMKSPEGWREFIAALKDGGEISVEIQSKPETPAYQSMIADFSNDNAESYSIEFPDGSKWVCSAFITGMETPVPLGDKIVTSATFKVSGKPVFTGAV